MLQAVDELMIASVDGFSISKVDEGDCSWTERSAEATEAVVAIADGQILAGNAITTAAG